MKIDPETFARCLISWNIPNPDLVIRTGGEQRISNIGSSPIDVDSN